MCFAFDQASLWQSLKSQSTSFRMPHLSSHILQGLLLTSMIKSQSLIPAVSSHLEPGHLGMSPNVYLEACPLSDFVCSGGCLPELSMYLQMGSGVIVQATVHGIPSACQLSTFAGAHDLEHRQHVMEHFSSIWHQSYQETLTDVTKREHSEHMGRELDEEWHCIYFLWSCSVLHRKANLQHNNIWSLSGLLHELPPPLFGKLEKPDKGRKSSVMEDTRL